MNIPTSRILHNIDGRGVDREKVKELAESIKRLGLLNPIIVRDCEVPTLSGYVPGYMVVAGDHRLEAAKTLGWMEIEAETLADDDPKTARLVTIAENLHRSELTALERDRLVAEWCELVGEKLSQVEPVSRQPDAKPKGGRPEGGTREAARQLNLSEPDVRRARQVASLSPEAQEKAVELGLDDNRSALLDAAKAPSPAEQVGRLEARKNPKPDDAAEKIKEMVDKMFCLIIGSLGKTQIVEVIARLQDYIDTDNEGK